MTRLFLIERTYEPDVACFTRITVSRREGRRKLISREKPFFFSVSTFAEWGAAARSLTVHLDIPLTEDGAG